MLTQYRFLNNDQAGVIADTAERSGEPVFIEGLTTHVPTRRLEVEFTVAWEVRQRVRHSATTAWAVHAAPYRNSPEELALLLGLPPDDPDDDDGLWLFLPPS